MKQASNSQVFMLENIRFWKEETSKEVTSEPVIEFRKKLASLAEIFVLDGFGVAHRD